MGKRHAGRLWLTIFAASLMVIILVSTAFTQANETPIPEIGMVSITALDPETGEKPDQDAEVIDYKISWELCTMDGDSAEIPWVSEKYKAYSWSVDDVDGFCGSIETPPSNGVDSSEFMSDVEFVFEDNDAHLKHCFQVKGILTHEDGTTEEVVLSPVGMDIWPHPVPSKPTFISLIIGDISDWITTSNTRTRVFLVVIVVAGLFGLFWFFWCRARQGYGALFPTTKGMNEEVRDLIMVDVPGSASIGKGDVEKLIEDTLSDLDLKRGLWPKHNSKDTEAKDLPAYRIMVAAVKTFVDPGSDNDDIQNAVDSQVCLELSHLRTRSHVDWIWNMSYVEPLIGLLGTVTGLSAAFWAKTQDISADMNAGITEALRTTIAGLIASIILVLLYNYCDHRYHRIEGAYQKLGAGLIARLRK